MKQVIRYILMAAVIISILYAYFTTPEKTEKGLNFTPKQVIETIEEKKAEERSKNRNPTPSPENATQ